MKIPLTIFVVLEFFFKVAKPVFAIYLYIKGRHQVITMINLAVDLELKSLLLCLETRPPLVDALVDDRFWFSKLVIS